ncbi:MAG TPA: MORN motif-containing protein, partial [Deltaproteobacteria bacterium]|nr:MORN motif-containing protein [Deltaproteobacteria bacterium]
IFYFTDGEKWVGEFREDAPWVRTWFDRDGNIIAKWGNGVKLK